MSKKAIIIASLAITLWWVPLGPLAILLPIWGIIESKEVYQVRANLAFTLSVIALVLAVFMFMFDTVFVLQNTLLQN